MSGSLPNWFERWLGIPSGPGEGIVWNLEYAWPLPPWLSLLAAAAIVALVVYVYLRESRQAGRVYRLMLAGVRLVVLAIVVFMIAQVSIALRRTGLPYIAVLVDDSLSMTTADRYDEKVHAQLLERMKRAGLTGEPTRWQLARTIVSQRDGALLERLATDYKLRFYYLSGQQTTAESPKEIVADLARREAQGEATRLGAAVRGILDELRGTAPAAIVLLSDGINTDGPPLSQAAEYARGRGVPLFTIALGSGAPLRNLKLTDLLVDDVVFLGDLVSFEVKLTGTGYQGTKVAVALREKDKTETLAKTEVVVGPDGQPQIVRLPYRPTREGRFHFVVEVEPQKDEQQTDDNRQEQAVDVRKEKVRVLLVEGYPTYEFRFLRNMLGRDDTIELSTVLQDADLEYAEQDSAALRLFPVRREDLLAFDVLIFGDVNPSLLGAGALQNIADFVDQPGKGGAIVFLAGPRFMPAAYRNTPLERLLPFDVTTVRDPPGGEEAFVVAPTELGLLTPGLQLGDTPQETRAIWPSLGALHWMLEVPDVRRGVRVLAEHPTKMARDGERLPVIMMHYVGAGKVMFHATDETYRWRWRVGDVYFARYWVQTLRYLARAKLAEGGRTAVLTTDQDRYERGELVRLRVKFIDERFAPTDNDGVTVAVTQPGRPQMQVELPRAAVGRATFEGVVGQLPPGSYRAWVLAPPLDGQSPTVEFAVNPPAGELERIEMDAAALRHAAEVTRGKSYTFHTADALVGDLPPGRQVPFESLPSIELWNRWPVLALLLLLLVGEWVLRKLGGMV
jgi:hypothetical protein